MYSAVNYYLGLRGWQTLGPLLPGYSRIYWLTFSFLALAYLASRAGQTWLPSSIYDALTFIGAFWLAFLYYGFLLTLLADILRLLDRFIPFLPAVIKQKPAFAALAILLLLGGILAYGTWNARHPVIQRYDLTIAKSAGQRSALHAVAVSDVHLGNIIGADRLNELVDSINALHPDIVLFVGDTVDAELKPFIDQNMGDVLRRLQPQLGVYAVLGNHEYIGREPEAIVENLEKSGVRILRDRQLLIDDSFILAGRDEYSSSRYANRLRAPLSAILAGSDFSRPVILLDHQPVALAESQIAGVDLQLSGHTHRGQLFPNNFVTAAIFEVDWGYLKKGALQVLVSSGYGTWGPPVRTGNRPELLDLYITFKK